MWKNYKYFQAEEFQEVVSIMREFLPEAEAQLKFRTLPDDEVAILQMIEKHEVSQVRSFLCKVK